MSAATMRATYKKIGKAPTIWGWRSPPWQGRVAPSFPLNSLYGNREAKFPKKKSNVSRKACRIFARSDFVNVHRVKKQLLFTAAIFAKQKTNTAEQERSPDCQRH